MNYSLPAPRLLDPAEGSYTTAEVAAGITETTAELLEDLEFSLETLAAVDGLTAAQSAVGAELRAAAHRVVELARLLQLTAA